MQLHLILPGLLWPSQVLRDTASDLELPALSWLLGRGRLSRHPPQTPEQALCAAFGLDATEPPYAALRLLGEGGAPGDDVWLCADPMHLALGQRRMTLSLDAPPADADEVREIVAALAPHLAALGEFVGGADGHCYLRLKQQPDIVTTPPSLATSPDSMLPQGGDALRWRQLANEAQMLLHALPCNRKRDSAGLPRLNSLWFWGAGRQPHAAQARHQRIFGDDPVLRGLARLVGLPLEHATRPDEIRGYPHGRVLLLLSDLQLPARAYDALRWREALLDLERRWLEPLRDALNNGRITRLTITGLGDESGFGIDVELTRNDRLRFWRRPRALHTLHHADAARPKRKEQAS